MSSKIFRNVAFCGAFLALGFALAILFVVPRSDKAPEFFGAFAAALIAGAALILGTFYQSSLTWQLEQKQREQKHAADAVNLFFWLKYCDFELQFVSTALSKIKETLTSQNKTTFELPIGTFREIITPRFFDDLLERARSASQLPPEISSLIAGDLYETFTIVDRIFRLRQASDDYRPSLEALEKYIFVLGRRTEKLRADARLIEMHLIKINALPKFPETP